MVPKHPGRSGLASVACHVSATPAVSPTGIVCTLLALGLTMASAGLAGCSSEECTLELRVYTIEVTREVVTDEAPEKLSIEACIAGRPCRTATPDATGGLAFDGLGDEGAHDGTLWSSAPGTKRIMVRYFVWEGPRDGSTALTLRVKREDATLLDSNAAVRWSDTDCHTSPRATKL